MGPQGLVLGQGRLRVGLLRRRLHWLSPFQSRFGHRLCGDYYGTGFPGRQVFDPWSVEITTTNLEFRQVWIAGV